MLILWSSSASQMLVPAGTEISAPLGQYSGWGKILMTGIVGFEFGTSDQIYKAWIF
jgi:hypothetical protein